MDTPSIPLEDNFADVIGKAQRGLQISDSVLAARAGIPIQSVQQLRAGHFDASAARAVAPLLGLDANSLVALGENTYRPGVPGDVSGLAQFNTPFGDMFVNSYLIWDPAAREAAAFDTGSDCSPMLECLAANDITLRYIFLTHTHGDHILDLDRLRERMDAPAFVSSREPLEGAEPIEPGREFPLGGLRITGRLTWGHSPGGMTYVVTGFSRQIAAVGDAMFAGSMGGGSVSYKDALRTNREEILSLPNDTIICPGHGPMTTVAVEKESNPFFAMRQ
jgi:glyoxylase-like metal-dependent hydrolase (beta-lactamase superfamily II)